MMITQVSVPGGSWGDGPRSWNLPTNTLPAQQSPERWVYKPVEFGYCDGVTTDRTDNDHAGLALITGASSGIGLALAREFAAHGFDLIITAEDDRLEPAAYSLHETGRAVTAVRADLTDPKAVESLWFQATGLHQPIDVAVLNAGVGVGGAFAQTSLERQLALVDLNVRSTVHLAKLVTDHMIKNGSGRIMITSSVAATAPGPYQATYAASKAFGHSFAEGLREELKNTGITVTSLMPGPTATDFFRRAGMLDTALGRGPKDDPAGVAKDAFNAILDGKPHVVPGSLKNRLIAEAATHLPDRLSTAAMAKQTKPREAHSEQAHPKRAWPDQPTT